MQQIGKLQSKSLSSSVRVLFQTPLASHCTPLLVLMPRLETFLSIVVLMALTSQKVVFIHTFAHGCQHLGHQFGMPMPHCVILFCNTTYGYVSPITWAIVTLCLSSVCVSQVGTLNSTGQHYHGHFDIWTINRLQEQVMFLRDVLKNPIEIQGWVNGNLYVPTSERMGILPIPDDVWHSSGMAEFSPILDGPKQAHQYLAQKQGTRKAILPVHTSAEIDLFWHLMEANPAFNSTSSGPIWKLAVKVWNEIADREDGVFYKVCILH